MFVLNEPNESDILVDVGQFIEFLMLDVLCSVQSPWV